MVNSAKIVLNHVVCVIFLILGVSMALDAHHYQTISKPMPNGKGGFMTFRDGYYLALCFFAVATGCFVFAFNSWRRRRSKIED
jgi:hypothetical protein